MSKHNSTKPYKSENIGEKSNILINSKRILIDKFVRESIGLYINQKNNEHTSTSSNEEIKLAAKEDLTNWLDGIENNNKEVDILINTIKHNLDNYINKIDHDLTELRDQILLEKGVKSKDSIELDYAILEAASSYNFFSVSLYIQKLLAINSKEIVCDLTEMLQTKPNFYFDTKRNSKETCIDKKFLDFSDYKIIQSSLPGSINNTVTNNITACSLLDSSLTDDHSIFLAPLPFVEAMGKHDNQGCCCVIL